jgi:hypothetical protein
MGNKKRNVPLPYSQWATRSEMFRFHSHNTYNVVLVKEAKLLASTQPMRGNKKRNVSLPLPQHIYICTIYVVLVKEAKLLASIQTMGNKKRNVSLPIPQQYIQLFQLRLSPEQSGKVEYERERLLGIETAVCTIYVV